MVRKEDKILYINIYFRKFNNFIQIILNIYSDDWLRIRARKPIKIDFKAYLGAFSTALKNIVVFEMELGPIWGSSEGRES